MCALSKGKLERAPSNLWRKRGTEISDQASRAHSESCIDPGRCEKTIKHIQCDSVKTKRSTMNVEMFIASVAASRRCNGTQNHTIESLELRRSILSTNDGNRDRKKNPASKFQALIGTLARTRPDQTR